MKSLLKRFWPVLAVVAGVALVAFEWRLEGGVTAENWFWITLGAVIVVLGVLTLLGVGKHLVPEERERGTEINKPLE